MIPNAKPLIGSAAVAVALVLAACVTAPPDDSLAQARAAVSSAAANPDVARYDALDLAMAQKQLANAESAAQRDARDMADHEAYLAIRTANLAEVRADDVVAEQRVAVTDGQRAQATPRTAMVVLTDDYFVPGQDQLLPGAGKILDGLAEFLVAHPERRVRIEGHSDSAGTVASNLGLPLHRAEAVRMALVARGVDPVRSEAVAYGPENPRSGSDNPADSAFIRGVDILLSDSRGQIASR
jgi:outer membrane protein OmpA-like peptidoglycan-associated protein